MRDRPAIIAPPPLLALLCIIAGFIAGHYAPLAFFPGPPALRIAVASVVFVSAIAIVVVARRELIKHHEHPNPYKPTGAIVSTGIYGRTRNPIYIALHIVVLALAIAANNAWLLVAMPVLFVLLEFGVVRAEERYLAGKFGAEYAAYRQKVRRWL